jgi:hypothetical protein
MDRYVLVHRCKRTGAFLLNPVAASGPSDINLWEVPADATDESLGQTAIDLLAPSGRPDAAPTGASSGESQEERTGRIWSQYGFDGPTSKLAKRFLLAGVEQKDGRKSWVVQVLCYDPSKRAMSGEDQPSTRVRHSAGAATLGVALRAALDLPGRRTLPMNSSVR